MTDYSFLNDEQRSFAATPEGQAALAKAVRDHASQSRYGYVVFDPIVRDCINAAMSNTARLDVLKASASTAGELRSLSNRLHPSRLRYY